MTPSASLAEQLRQYRLLAPDQLEALPGLVTARPAATALVADLLRRGWLTEYQAERLLEGRPAELVVGGYRLLDLLGQGAVGQVFKAQHIRMGRVVALKLLSGQAPAGSRVAQRFEQEMQVAARLAHPNVAQAFDAGEAGGRLYLAMEYVDGTDLAALVRKSGPMGVPLACELGRQAALGLQHAHEQGLIHRDVKPSNLMLVRPRPDAPLLLKVLDFGLARPGDGGGQGRLTQVGSLVGTVDYISPEQAGDARAADARSDVYSLGCSLFFLLAGHAPFPGKDVVERIGARVLGDAPLLRSGRPEAPVALEAVLAKMLARDPARRYQRAAEVAEALESFAASLRAPRKAPPPPPPVATVPPPLPIPEGSRRKVDRPLPGKRVPWVALAAGGVLGLLVLVTAAVVAVGYLAPPRPATQGGSTQAKEDPVRVVKRPRPRSTPKKVSRPRLGDVPPLRLAPGQSMTLVVPVKGDGDQGPWTLHLVDLPPDVTTRPARETVPPGSVGIEVSATATAALTEGTEVSLVLRAADRVTDQRKASLVIETVEAHVVYLGDELDRTDPAARRRAAARLRAIEPAKARPATRKLLALAGSEPDAAVRREVAMALAGLVDKTDATGADNLKVLLKDPDPDTALHAALALSRLGEGHRGAAVPVLREALNGADAGRREMAAAMLAQFRKQAAPALEELAQGLADREPAVRRNCCIALGHIGPAAGKATPALVKALHPPEKAAEDPARARLCEEVRVQAAEALAQIGYPANAAAMPALREALARDKNQGLRQRCVWALFNVPDLEKYDLTRVLTNILDEKGKDRVLVRYDCARVLAYKRQDHAPDTAVEVLLHMLDNREVKVFGGTETSINGGNKDGSGTASKTTAIVGDDCRWMAAQALGQMKDKAKNNEKVVAALRAAVKDTEPRLRKEALEALGRLGLKP